MRKVLRDLLEEKKALCGCFVQIPSPEVVEMARNYDYVILDYEHGHISFEQLVYMVRAAESQDLAVMVRMAGNNPVEINKVLDTGVTALLFSDVSGLDAAKKLVDATHYYPEGNRGACPFTRANYYGTGTDRDTYYKKANRDVYVIATIEDLDGLKDMEQIISTDGIDGLGVGMFDLSVAMGIPGKIYDPKVQEAIGKAQECAKKYGKVFTTMIMKAEEAENLDLSVCRLVMSGAPELYLQNYLNETAASVISKIR